MGENTRQVYDIMQYAERNNIPGLILLIDFEKAFDSISWKFIHKVLQYFNFGHTVKQWITDYSTKMPNYPSTNIVTYHHSSIYIEDADRAIHFPHISLFFVLKF